LTKVKNASYVDEKLIFLSSGTPDINYIVIGAVCVAFTGLFWGLCFAVAGGERLAEVMGAGGIIAGCLVPFLIGVALISFGIFVYFDGKTPNVIITTDEFIIRAGGGFICFAHSEIDGVDTEAVTNRHGAATYGYVIINAGDEKYKVKILDIEGFCEIFKGEKNDG